ncbi:MAG TPA: EthD family reductase [Lacunisphaera sp.]|nr:EthD family reductase [Lacunisphaera sp.]
MSVPVAMGGFGKFVLLVSLLRSGGFDPTRNRGTNVGTMIRVSVLYPASAGANFDWAYYTSQHIPLVNRLLGRALKGVSVARGLGGEEPGSPAPFVAMADLRFESIESFQAAIGPHLEAINADILNYTSIMPVVQISEIIAT